MATIVVSDAQKAQMEELLPKGEDLLYEEELLRNPFSLKMWWRYIQARSDASAKRRYLLYERALRALPGSYKVGAWRRALPGVPARGGKGGKAPLQGPPACVLLG